MSEQKLVKCGFCGGMVPERPEKENWIFGSLKEYVCNGCLKLLNSNIRNEIAEVLKHTVLPIIRENKRKLETLRRENENISENTVEIPKAMADSIREMEWFKLYIDFEDFVLDAVRRHVKNVKWRR